MIQCILLRSICDLRPSASFKCRMKPKRRCMTKTSAAAAAKTPPRVKKVTAQKLKKEKSRQDAKRKAAASAEPPKKPVLKKKKKSKSEEETRAESPPPRVSFNDRPEVTLVTPPRTTRARQDPEPVNSPRMSLDKAKDILDDMCGQSEEAPESSSEALRFDNASSCACMYVCMYVWVCFVY